MRVPVQCQDMMALRRAGPSGTDSPEPFTDRLRLAVAAYLARFKGSCRAHRIRPVLLPVLVRRARSGPAGAQRPHLELYIRWMKENPPVQALHHIPPVLGRGRVLPNLRHRRPDAAFTGRACATPRVPAESPTLGFTHLQFEALLIAAAIVSAGCRLSARVNVTFRISAPAGPDRASCLGRGSSSSPGPRRPDVGDRGGSAAQRTGNQVARGKQPGRSPAKAQLPDRRRVDPVVADEDH
jgi:hypothetical protein